MGSTLQAFVRVKLVYFPDFGTCKKLRDATNVVEDVLKERISKQNFLLLANNISLWYEKLCTTKDFLIRLNSHQIFK